MVLEKVGYLFATWIRPCLGYKLDPWISIYIVCQLHNLLMSHVFTGDRHFFTINLHYFLTSHLWFFPNLHSSHLKTQIFHKDRYPHLHNQVKCKTDKIGATVFMQWEIKKLRTATLLWNCLNWLVCKKLSGERYGRYQYRPTSHPSHLTVYSLMV